MTINSIDSKASEKIEITGSKLADFTTIKRPTLTELKEKFQHVQGNKGQPEDPIVEGTTFGWIVHGGKEYADSKCMYVRETDEYERLYSLDVLGVEDRGEDDLLDIYKEFQESISREAMAGTRWACRGSMAPSSQIQMRSPAGNAFTM